MNFTKLSKIVLNPDSTAYDRMLELTKHPKLKGDELCTIDLRNEWNTEVMLGQEPKFRLPLQWVQVKTSRKKAPKLNL